MNPFKERFDTNTKNLQYKKRIVDYYIHNGPDTLTVLAKELDISVPTANKFVTELCNTKILKSYGKLETAGGRHPYLYGLSPEECFFVGVDFSQGKIHFALMNFSGEKVHEHMDIPFTFENTPECLKAIIKETKKYLKEIPQGEDSVVSVGINIFGRSNPDTGFSYTYFNFDEKPLSEHFTEGLGVPTYIDNDARACAYGEYMTHYKHMGKNMLFVNVTWGLGLGIIINGEPYNGKSGFSGEFGHMHAYENEVLCHCGKKGCLETEASGLAMHRKLIERIREGGNSIVLEKYNNDMNALESITLEDMVDATRNEDILCIEILEEVGEKLGMHIAGLINLFNSDVVVIGGVLARTGDYILHPLKSAIRKYSLNMVNQDTDLKLSNLQGYAGVIGGAMLARKKAVEALTIAE